VRLEHSDHLRRIGALLLRERDQSAARARLHPIRIHSHRQQQLHQRHVLPSDASSQHGKASTVLLVHVGAAAHEALRTQAHVACLRAAAGRRAEWNLKQHLRQLQAQILADVRGQPRRLVQRSRGMQLRRMEHRGAITNVRREQILHQRQSDAWGANGLLEHAQPTTRRDSSSGRGRGGGRGCARRRRRVGRHAVSTFVVDALLEGFPSHVDSTFEFGQIAFATRGDDQLRGTILQQLGHRRTTTGLFVAARKAHAVRAVDAVAREGRADQGSRSGRSKSSCRAGGRRRSGGAERERSARFRSSCSMSVAAAALDLQVFDVLCLAFDVDAEVEQGADALHAAVLPDLLAQTTHQLRMHCAQRAQGASRERRATG